MENTKDLDGFLSTKPLTRFASAFALVVGVGASSGCATTAEDLRRAAEDIRDIQCMTGTQVKHQKCPRHIPRIIK